MSDEHRLPKTTPHPEREIGAIPPGARSTEAEDEGKADGPRGVGADRKDGRGDVGGHSDPAAAPLGTDAETGEAEGGGIRPLRRR